MNVSVEHAQSTVDNGVLMSFLIRLSSLTVKPKDNSRHLTDLRKISKFVCSTFHKQQYGA